MDIEYCGCVSECVSVAFLRGSIVFYFSMDILSELNFMMMMMMQVTSCHCWRTIRDLQELVYTCHPY